MSLGGKDKIRDGGCELLKNNIQSSQVSAKQSFNVFAMYKCHKCHFSIVYFVQYLCVNLIKYICGAKVISRIFTTQKQSSCVNVNILNILN